ncbi:MAG: EAL domain-containing protein, partial [Oscillospiraceae bacterium]|nr:EAL domain-containing protein [Oscillospiraceae bacterium]
MTMRFVVPIILTLIAVILAACAFRGFTCHKKIGRVVGLLDICLIPPILGNMIVISTSDKTWAMVGYMIYFLGMDLVLYALVRFTDVYCHGIGNGEQKPTVMYLVLAADAVQMMLEPFLHHAYDCEPIDVGGSVYYKLVPLVGQVIHRIVDYSVFFSAILIFVLAVFKTARLYREKYLVILVTLLVVCVWQSFYIFSGTPVDRSMIGFGAIGIVVFYFSLYYRPMRLLDRMLSNIASDVSEAIFMFDPSGRCLWMNGPGMDFVRMKESELDRVTDKLEDIFGKYEPEKGYDWTENRVITYGGKTMYLTMENHSVSDDSRLVAGSFLVLRDNTEEQRRLQHELYISTHDSLTDLYTKEHLYSRARTVIDENEDTYLAMFVDVKNFKIVNDVFSTAFGDKALQQIADWIRSNMTEKCVYGRLAGDTFGVFMPADELDAQKLESELAGFIVTDGKIEHHLVIHIGIYEIFDRSVDISVMLDRAHLALSTINDVYSTHISWYDDILRDKVLWEQKMTSALHDAIDGMQIRPYLQPITDRNGRVVGAEALARWIHPEHGFMSPGMFIPVFEKNGMIVEVDRHMWRCACMLLSEWKGVHDGIFISVNISPMDFYFCDVVSEITGLIEEYGVDPSLLRIEITETVMMNDTEDKMKILNAFHDAGFIVEMDDFGSGYS